MKTVLTIAASAFTALGVSTGASAATFDFTFYTQRATDRPPVCAPTIGCAPEDYTAIGGGSLSFAGEAETGRYELDDLDDLAFSFTLGGSTFDQDDQAFSFGMPRLFIGTNDGDMHAYFMSSPPIYDDVASGVQLAEILRPESCFGEVSFLNDEGDCLNLGFGFSRRVTASEETVLQSFSMIPSFGDQTEFLAMGVPISGRYLGRLSVDPAAVPLPATLPLLALALGGMGYLRSRRS